MVVAWWSVGLVEMPLMAVVIRMSMAGLGATVVSLWRWWWYLITGTDGVGRELEGAGYGERVA
ncbi:uncharacterized protein M6B38_105960 [Iris pallida]|uniref:Transmembrane protein n=1 Tax=Iris pallida TaxID=29817 RepID=A0AAX6ES76_IRIPA|nr:uncharacterized protein M6B38_105960 [Iris pallida]